MKYNGHAPTLAIECGQADSRGQRLFVATFGGKEFRDRLDADNAFARRKFREALASRFDLDNDAHEYVESAIIAKADAADAEPAGLWQPSVVSLAEVQEKQTAWLWDAYLPLGSISVIDGDPGLGKSQLTVDLAARVSRGDAMPPLTAPDKTYKPRGVLMMNAEDDLARTMKPRLVAAGADLNRVKFMRSMVALDGADERLAKLPDDLQAIEGIIREHDVALVTIDPFAAFISSELNLNSDGDVRQCLGQMAVTAEATGAAFVIVRHLNKKSGLSAVYRGGGSIGIVGAARAALMVGKDPADSDSRILAPVKCNLAPEPPSLRFSIEAHGGTSRVRWGGACEVSAHDCLNASSKPTGGTVEQARAIIVEQLRDGARPSADVENAIRAAGIGDSSYRKARRELDAVTEKTGFQGQWMLRLPDPSDQDF